MYRMLGNVLLPSNYGHSHPVYWPYFYLTYVLHNMHHACIFLPFVTNVSPTTLCGQRNSYPFLLFILFAKVMSEKKCFPKWSILPGKCAHVHWYSLLLHYFSHIFSLVLQVVLDLLKFGSAYINKQQYVSYLWLSSLAPKYCCSSIFLCLV